jgi:hypothetical protein
MVEDSGTGLTARKVLKKPTGGRNGAQFNKIGTVGRKAALLRDTIFHHLWEIMTLLMDTILFPGGEVRERKACLAYLAYFQS